MTIRARKAIFYVLCAVFAAAGTLVVFYAQGWRLDFETFRFQKIGGIYLRSFPKDADIFLNNKYVDKKPGLLDSGRFINGIFPKNYTVKLTSDGYLDWSEHIQVNPSLVTELKYAVMIPKNSVSAASGTVENFWANNNQLVTGLNNSLFYGTDKIKGNEFIWQDADSKIALTKNATPQTYFANYLSDNTATSTNLNQKITDGGIRPANILEIIADPGSNNKVILSTAAKIFSLNAQTGEISAISSSTAPITKIAASRSFIAFVNFDSKSNKSEISFLNRNSGIKENKIEMSGMTVKLSFKDDGELGILQDDGSFYIISSGEQPQKTASDVRDFSFSVKNNLVALLENHAIEIFAFNAEKDYWRFRLPDNEKIKRLEWYADENHLFAFYDSEIKMLDLNDKELANFATVAESNQGHYDSRSNTFYFIKDGKLQKMVFPD